MQRSCRQLTVHVFLFQMKPWELGIRAEMLVAGNSLRIFQFTMIDLLGILSSNRVSLLAEYALSLLS